ncbi:MAG: hypothetical protein AABZ34_14860 [Nitrospirota bacterium]
MSNFPTHFQRFMIGSDTPQEEVGKRTNRYLGPEERWSLCGFNSQKECQEAFQDKRYQVDEEYRFAVRVMLSNSPEYSPGNAGSGIQIGNGVLERAMSNREAARRQQDQEIYSERISEMFNNPKYQTSPSYRREVEDFIRAHEAEIDQAVGHRAVDRTNATMPVRVQLDSNALSEAQAGLKTDKEATAKAEARARARAAYFREIGEEDPELANSQDDEE